MTHSPDPSFLNDEEDQTSASEGDLFVFPTSFAQQRFWLLDELESGSAYNIHIALRLSGRLNVSALEKGLNEITRRHEALRTTFRSTGGRPVQVISKNISFKMPLVDLSGQPKAEREVEAQRLTRDEAMRRFDIAKGPLFSAILIRLSEEEHMLLLTMHHIVSDGWSMGVLTAELAALYKAYCNGEASPLPELPIQYADFAHWQREWLQGEVLENQLSYWRKQLEGVPVLQLPSDHPRPAVQTYRGARQSLLLSATLTEALNALSHAEGATLFMTLLAAFNTLLYRHTGQEDIVVGSPIANRNRVEIEGLIGLFVNSLVMRTDLSGNPTFCELIHRVQRVALGAYEHQDLPFEKLVEELNPERDMSHTPLFQVMFNMTNVKDIEVELHNLSVEGVSSVESESKFDFTLYVMEIASGIELRLVYNTDLFDNWRMAEMLKQYEALLKQIVENPDEKISHYSLVTAEARQVLPDPSALLTEPVQPSIIEMFANWVKQTPDQLALSKGDQTLTYEKLFERTQILAKILRLNGLDRRDVVAVYGPRSFGLIANMMAVFLSGGVLLPVDSGLPRQRQQLILQEAGAKFLLYIRDKGFEDAWWEQDSALGVQLLEVDHKGLVRADPDFDLDAVSLPEPGVDDAAYIFFTSGTTGVPKGVLGSHKGLNHFLNWQRETFDITPEDRMAHLTSLSFDPVLREIFLPLTSGATLCLPEDIDILAANDVLSWIDRERISVLHTVPSLAQSWLNNATVEVSLNAMRWVFFAGESLTENLVDRWQSSFPSGEIVNLYGPAETTLAKCFYQLSCGVHHGVQPLGRPLPQTQALVLSRDNQLCAIGEPGEIVFRTPFRSLGYINNHEENRKRFVKNPFRDDEKDQLYYTGDRGRYRPDGMLEFLGRLDDQVKIRGVRVEPNEVTVILARHPEVDSCFVTNERDEQRQPRLVAYVVLTEQSKTTVSELRADLSKELPVYMIPSAFVFLDALPLTTRGKVDRRALPGSDLDHSRLETKFVAPRTPVEKVLVKIWGEVLGLERVGVYDNFFELGGHSLLAAQVLSRAHDNFEMELPLLRFFETPTIAGLTELIETFRLTEKEPRSYHETTTSEREVGEI